MKNKTPYSKKPEDFIQVLFANNIDIYERALRPLRNWRQISKGKTTIGNIKNMRGYLEAVIYYRKMVRS